MTCYRPIRAYRSPVANANGKYPLRFPKGKKLPEGEGLNVACGRCIGCRLDYSRAWAIRCLHEASEHEQNSFITLTYDDEHLPHNQSLNKVHWQLFMKRLRRHFEPTRFRYYYCGEYGDQFRRPHYHACIFGLDFPDKVLHTTNHRGDNVYTSQTLSDLWGQGFVTVGAVNFETAAYVARYVLKKITGAEAEDHYKSVNWATGEVVDLQPEYVTMSRVKGIGHAYYQKHKNGLYPTDELVYKSNGKYLKMKVPKYYDSQFEIEDPERMARVKARRVAKAKFNSDTTDRRLRDREKVKERQKQMLKRKL